MLLWTFLEFEVVPMDHIYIVHEPKRSFVSNVIWGSFLHKPSVAGLYLKILDAKTCLYKHLWSPEWPT